MPRGRKKKQDVEDAGLPAPKEIPKMPKTRKPRKKPIPARANHSTFCPVCGYPMSCLGLDGTDVLYQCATMTGKCKYAGQRFKTPATMLELVGD